MKILGMNNSDSSIHTLNIVSHHLFLNIATKRNGMRTNATVGAEKITEIADFRTYDLDSLLETTDFDQFAAEVLFFRFATMGGAKEVPISVEQLRDPNRIASPSKCNL